MAKKRKMTQAVGVGRVLASIRAAKGVSKGMAWNLLHRMESMAATANGIKAKRRAKPTKKKRASKSK